MAERADDSMPFDAPGKDLIKKGQDIASGIQSGVDFIQGPLRRFNEWGKPALGKSAARRPGKSRRRAY